MQEIYKIQRLIEELGHNQQTNLVYCNNQTCLARYKESYFSFEDKTHRCMLSNCSKSNRQRK